MLAALLALLLAHPATANVIVITPEQAKDHVGQEVVVQGQVSEGARPSAAIPSS
jgi:hypothetical protein